MSTSESVTSETAIFTGRVKWFNNKSGFGFITTTEDEQDIFVHHSSISVDSEQYRYLVQGEYVEFARINTSNPTHSCQAGNVRGIKGGKLMCETRNEFRSVKPESAEPQFVVPKYNKNPSAKKVRGEGPREGLDLSYASKVKSRLDKPLPSRSK